MPQDPIKMRFRALPDDEEERRRREAANSNLNQGPLQMRFSAQPDSAQTAEPAQAQRESRPLWKDVLGFREVEDTNRSAVSNIARGIGMVPVNAAAFAVGLPFQLAGAGVDFFRGTSDKPVEERSFLTRTANAISNIRNKVEDKLDPEGWAGVAGNWGTLIVPAALPEKLMRIGKIVQTASGARLYGPYIRATERGTKAVLERSGIPAAQRVAGAIGADLTQTGTRLQRVAGQAVGQLPLDVAQSFTAPEDMTTGERLRSVLTQQIAGAGLAAIPGSRPDQRLPEVDITKLDPGETARLEGDRSPDAAAKAKRFKIGAEAQKLIQSANRTYKTEVWKRWQAQAKRDGLNVDPKTMDKEAKDNVINGWAAEHVGEVAIIKLNKILKSKTGSVEVKTEAVKRLRESLGNPEHRAMFDAAYDVWLKTQKRPPEDPGTAGVEPSRPPDGPQSPEVAPGRPQIGDPTPTPPPESVRPDTPPEPIGYKQNSSRSFIPEDAARTSDGRPVTDDLAEQFRAKLDTELENLRNSGEATFDRTQEVTRDIYKQFGLTDEGLTPGLSKYLQEGNADGYREILRDIMRYELDPETKARLPRGAEFVEDPTILLSIIARQGIDSGVYKDDIDAARSVLRAESYVSFEAGRIDAAQHRLFESLVERVLTEAPKVETYDELVDLVAETTIRVEQEIDPAISLRILVATVNLYNRVRVSQEWVSSIKKLDDDARAKVSDSNLNQRGDDPGMSFVDHRRQQEALDALLRDIEHDVRSKAELDQIPDIDTILDQVNAATKSGDVATLLDTALRAPPSIAVVPINRIVQAVEAGRVPQDQMVNILETIAALPGIPPHAAKLAEYITGKLEGGAGGGESVPPPDVRPVPDAGPSTHPVGRPEDLPQRTEARPEDDASPDIPQQVTRPWSIEEVNRASLDQLVAYKDLVLDYFDAIYPDVADYPSHIQAHVESVAAKINAFKREVSSQAIESNPNKTKQSRQAVDIGRQEISARDVGIQELIVSGKARGFEKLLKLDETTGTVDAEQGKVKHTIEQFRAAFAKRLASFETDPKRGKGLATETLIELKTWANAQLTQRDHGKRSKTKISDHDRYRTAVEVIDEILAARSNNPDGKQLMVTVKPIVGFFIGYNWPTDDEESRMRNGLMGAALSIAPYSKIYNKLRTPAPKLSVPGESSLDGIVTTYDQREQARTPTSFYDRIRMIYNNAAKTYANVVHPALGAVEFSRAMGSADARAALNPGKLYQMMGRAVSWSANWIEGRPTDPESGTPVLTVKMPDGREMPVRSLVDISNLAQGHTEILGKLMAARTALEIADRKGSLPHPDMDIDQLVRFVSNAPKFLHDAADASRAFNLALVDVLVSAGVIEEGARNKMASEDWYAALERAFGPAMPSLTVELKNKVGGKVTHGPNPIKRRKGPASYTIKNPFETMGDNVYRMMRAAEDNIARRSIAEMAEANPEASRFWAKRTDPAGARQTPNARTTELATVVGKDVADALTELMDPQKIPAADADRVAVFRNGKKEYWAVHPLLAIAVKSMKPHSVESSMLWLALGAVNQPLKKGIAYDPFFVTRQSWRDNWQITSNSQYGFRPGIDWIRGFNENWKRGPVFRAVHAEGGGGATFLQREVLNPKARARAVAAGGEGSAGAIALRQVKHAIKTWDARGLLDAYLSLIQPVAEAGRMGEALLAVGHGKPVLDAVHAYKQVGGFYNQLGPAMRGYASATLFFNPAIQALDQAWFRSGTHPFRAPTQGRANAALSYTIKNIMTLGIPALALYIANMNDEQITELRSSESGRRFFWIRDPLGNIQRFAKPQHEGQIFATSVELALDRWFSNDPDGFKKFTDSWLNDIMPNVVPTALNVPLSLAQGRDMSLGYGILPSRASRLQTQYQTTDQTTQIAQNLSGLFGGSAPTNPQTAAERGIAMAVSPVGIEYIIRGFGGTLAGEGLRAVDQFIKWTESGRLPASHEWPLVRETFGVKYPKGTTGSVEEFYRYAEISEKAMNTLTYLAQTDPTAVPAHIEKNRPAIMAAELFRKTRESINDLRSAIYTTQKLDRADQISPDDKAKLIDTYRLTIIKLARTATTINRGFISPQSTGRP